MIEWLATIEKLEHKVLIASLWLVIVAIAAVLTDRFSPRGSEFVRKVVHIGTGQIILLAWWLNIPAWVGISAGIFFSAVAIASYYLPLLPSINNVNRQSWGTCFYAMSIGILIALFWPIGKPEYAVLGVLIMSWGDGLAGLIGQRFGQHRYLLWGSKKSWEGSITMAIVSTIMTLLVLLPNANNPQVWPIALIATIVGVASAGLETWGKWGIDNLTVPIGSAILAYGLMHLL
jgi:phytol kinase